MATVTNQMLYEELLKLDSDVKQLVESMQETVAFARETNRQLAEGQARTEALKKRLFGNRFKHATAAE